MGRSRENLTKTLLGQAADGDENQGTKQSTEAKDARNNTLVFVAGMTIKGLKPLMSGLKLGGVMVEEKPSRIILLLVVHYHSHVLLGKGL